MSKKSPDVTSIDLSLEDDDWAVEPVAPSHEHQAATTRDLKKAFQEAVARHGGVEQYLPRAASVLTDWLLQTFPVDANVYNDTSSSLPTSDHQALNSGSPEWGSCVAVKGPTESALAEELMEHILVEGFNCSNNLLLVTQPPELLAQRQDL